MKSLWSDETAAAYVARYGERWGEALALRVYTSHLIGSDPDLVLAGGGNTSVKGSSANVLGDRIDVLRMKGSGLDLATIDPGSFPALDLGRLRPLRALGSLSDDEMANLLRSSLLDSGAPSPSVEVLLHAFLPHRYVDHAHADAVLVLVNQPTEDAEDFLREAYGDRWAVVPYRMPGLELAKLAADVYERNPDVDGLVLMNHGLVTFGDDARTAYERLVGGVDRAERLVRERSTTRTLAALDVKLEAPDTDAIARLAPVLRGALASPTGDADRPWRRAILDHRTSVEILLILAGPHAKTIAASGPLTPDHVIHTKWSSLLLPKVALQDETALAEKIAEEVGLYRERHDSYFESNRARARGPVTKLDASPRVVLVPGVGLFAAGRTKREARVTADLAEHALRAKDSACAIGRYAPLDEGHLFDMEYWRFQRAKLETSGGGPLEGQVALVTGAAGAIGFEVSKKLVEAGAHVVVADLGRERVEEAVAELDPDGHGLAVPLVMDVTDDASVASGFRDACRTFGGVDIVVPNAGIAEVATLERSEPASFRSVVDVNLVGCFLVLHEAAAVFRRQGTGGHVVIVSTKNVFAPGASFGAYSASKAGAHQLGRVAALELAEMGVRVNFVNVDAVFGDERRPSGLWEKVGPDRAKARGVDPAALPDFYRERNLLKARVTGAHVGNAVVFFVSNLTPTTGASLPVDGGLPDAFPR